MTRRCETLDGTTKQKRIFMATPNIRNSRNKVVVAFLDGRRVKGYIHSFSAQEDHFRLFLEHDTAPREGTDVQMKDLKAIFFARDFVAIAGTANLRNLTRKVRAAKPKLPFVMGKSWWALRTLTIGKELGSSSSPRIPGRTICASSSSPATRCKFVGFDFLCP